MIPESVATFFAAQQEVLWIVTLLLDLGFTLLLYRLFGKVGLQVAIATAIILANLQGPKLTIIFGFETSLGVIFYSSIFLATDMLSENYGKREAARAVWMGFGQETGHSLGFPVPSIKIVQQQGSVEIMRGCPTGCRFCQAGYHYRPARVKQPVDIAA